MRSCAALIGGFSLAASFATLAVVSPAAADDGPTSFVCTFKDGTSWSYSGGAFQSKQPSPLSLTIEHIDLEKQTAIIKAAEGESPGKLSVVRAINANHFIEAVNEGFLNLTTIYDKDPDTGLYPAVHSRHFGILGQPVFAQYNGTCQPE